MDGLKGEEEQVVTEDGDGSKLSKNQKRKLARKEAILKSRREKRTEERRRRTEKRRAGLAAPRVNDVEFREKLAAAVASSSPRVCVDFQFAEKMSEKEKVHLAQQVCRLYGCNRKSNNPLPVTFANLDKASPIFQLMCQKNAGFENYVVDFTEKDVTDVFSPESVVYLSPDATEDLESVENGFVYVFGGLVDETRQGGQTLGFASEKQLTTRRLPILKYMDKVPGGTYNQILTLNQVFGILLSAYSSKDWPKALEEHVPSRCGFKPKMDAQEPTQ